MLYRRGGPGEPERMPVANVDYPRYAAEIEALRSKYRDRITIKMGMEFGMQTHTITQYEKLYSAYPFDFIILSVHQVEDKEFWTQDFQRGRTQEEYNLRYYEEILALVQQYHDYSVLGHLDLISRYDEAGCFPFEKIKPIVTEILKTVISDGKGIEINTSSHRYGLRDLTPSVAILQLYRGKITPEVTFSGKITPEVKSHCIEGKPPQRSVFIVKRFGLCQNSERELTN